MPLEVRRTKKVRLEIVERGDIGDALMKLGPFGV